MIVAYTKPEVKGTGGGGAIRKSVRSCSFLNRFGEKKSCLFKIFPDLKILVTWCLWLPNSSLFGMVRDIAEENMFPPTSSRLAQRSAPYREPSMEPSSLTSSSESRLKLHTWSPVANSLTCSFHPSKMMYRVSTQSLAQATPDVRNG